MSIPIRIWEVFTEPVKHNPIIHGIVYTVREVLAEFFFFIRITYYLTIQGFFFKTLPIIIILGCFFEEVAGMGRTVDILYIVAEVKDDGLATPFGLA